MLTLWIGTVAGGLATAVTADDPSKETMNTVLAAGLNGLNDPPPYMEIVSYQGVSTYGFVVTNGSRSGDAYGMIQLTIPAGSAASVNEAFFNDWTYSIASDGTVFDANGYPIAPNRQGIFEIYTDGTNPNWGYRDAGAESLTMGPFNAVPVIVPVIPISGDDDRDGDVDDSDSDSLEACASGPGVPYAPASLTPNGNYCAMFDFDADGDIDQADFGQYQACFSGEDVRSTCTRPISQVYPPRP